MLTITTSTLHIHKTCGERRSDCNKFGHMRKLFFFSFVKSSRGLSYDPRAPQSLTPRRGFRALSNTPSDSRSARRSAMRLRTCTASAKQTLPGTATSACRPLSERERATSRSGAKGRASPPPPRGPRRPTCNARHGFVVARMCTLMAKHAQCAMRRGHRKAAPAPRARLDAKASAEHTTRAPVIPLKSTSLVCRKPN